jgi:hypothetical protein
MKPDTAESVEPERSSPSSSVLDKMNDIEAAGTDNDQKESKSE